MPEDQERSSPAADAVPVGAAALPGAISDNIESIVAFHDREDQEVGSAQRRLARICVLISRPSYLAGGLAFVVCWVLWNSMAVSLGIPSFDPAPFPLLVGLVTLAAWLTTTVVLNSQSRNERLERHRAHLDLQVNLLTEQKVTKIIHLLEELRRDLPMVKDRHDPEADGFQRRTDTAQVLSAIHELGATAGTGDKRAPPSDT